MSNVLSTCKKCFNDFSTDELIWGDKGGQYWVCVDCYESDQRPLCGDHLVPLKSGCGCLR